MPPLPVAQITALLATVNGNNAQAKGQALEDLICCILDGVPGFKVWDRRIRNMQGSDEIDVAFWNDFRETGLSIMENTPILEAKNWQGKVPSDEIRNFRGKMDFRDCRCGIIVATHGVTGDADALTAAQNEIAFSQSKGRRIIVISLDELVTLTTSEGVVDLLKQKFCQLVFKCGQQAVAA